MPISLKDKIILTASDIGRPLISAKSEDTLLHIRNIMLRYNISRVAISTDERVIGIITEKDISKFLYENTHTRKRLSEISIKELLQNRNELITVDGTSPLQFCAKSMINNKISSLLLINRSGKIDEIITKTDLIEVFAYHYSGFFTVQDYMTTKVVTADVDETVHSISLLINNYDISRIVILKNKKPVGIITLNDFLPLSTYLFDNSFSKGDSEIELIDQDDSSNYDLQEKRLPRFLPSGIRSNLIALDIMKANPILINQNQDLTESSKIMIQNRISGLPVIDDTRYLVGIITKTDIIKSILDLPLD